MTRGSAKNIHYNYELIVDDTHQYFRTCKCIADHLGLSLATIRTKLQLPNHNLRQYKGVNIQIIKVHVPIFDIRVEQTKIEY